MPHPSDTHDQVFDVPEALLARGGRQLVSVTEEGVHIGSDGSAVHAQLHRWALVGPGCMAGLLGVMPCVCACMVLLYCEGVARGPPG